MVFSRMKRVPLSYLELLLDIFLQVLLQDFLNMNKYWSVHIKIYNTNTWVLLMKDDSLKKLAFLL